ncbi:MAG: hypothetical protein L7S44_08295 [Flavobacteriaceae bacterium]|jgi:hypothetical protein|nr:hypothetical protein [Flavobacteriaceae bacterium]
MKKLIILTSILSLSLIFIGIFIKNIVVDFEVFKTLVYFEISADKLTGSGVVGLFFIVFPLFSYYRWKDKNVEDYMLTQENLDKMKKSNDKN